MSSTTKAINSNESRYARVAGWLYRNRDKLILLLKTLFIVSLSILTITKPIYEWDLLAYMGNGSNHIHQDHVYIAGAGL